MRIRASIVDSLAGPTDEIFTRLFDAALDAVIGMDASGMVVAWNRQAETIFGWSREEALDQVLADLIIPAPLRAAHSAGMARYLSTGEGPVLNHRIEIEGLRRTGELFPVELTILPLGDAKSPYFFAFLRDISSRQDAEKRLRQSALEAEVLWEATRLVSTGGSLEELLRGCLERICRVTGWELGHAYLPDDEFGPEKLLPSPVWFFGKPELTSIAEASRHFAVPKGVGLPGRIWETGTAHWIADIGQEENFPRKGIFLPFGLHAAFGFPIYAQGRLQAILEFFSTAKRAPDQPLIYFVESLGEQLGRVLERQLARDQRTRLLQELAHRVGNTLSVVQSIFARSAAHAKTVEELTAAFDARLLSLASAHRLLAQGDWGPTDLADLVRAALEPYCAPNQANSHLTGPPIPLGASVVMPVTMILHELATNAAKHGALSKAEGRVQVSWEKDLIAEKLEVRVTWHEEGVVVTAPRPAGYGTTLIDETVQRGLGGSVRRAYTSASFEVEITFPLPASQSQA
jgi:PAS domain S-box-containing protein